MYKIIITPALETLLSQASSESRYWIADAVANKANNVADEISEACDDFCRANGPGSHELANEILIALQEEPIYALRNQPIKLGNLNWENRNEPNNED